MAKFSSVILTLVFFTSCLKQKRNPECSRSCGNSVSTVIRENEGQHPIQRIEPMLLSLLNHDTVSSSFLLAGCNALVNRLGQYYLKQIELDSNHLSGPDTKYRFEVCIENSDSIWINGMLGNSFVLQNELLESERISKRRGTSPLFEISLKRPFGDNKLPIKVASNLIQIIIQNHLRIMCTTNLDD